MIRVAAVGDVHYDQACRNRLKRYFDSLVGRADLLLIAGDLTQSGEVDEVKVLADDLKDVGIPVVAILGNHDYHRNKESDIRAVLTDVGVTMLEGNTVTFNVRGHSVGIAGVKGFGGGFGSGFCPEFGEPETKAFALAGKRQAQIIRDLLRSLNTDYKFALLHYAPVEHTLLGERREIYPFLGSYLLGEAIDQAGANAVFHGHAHYGTERGNTHGGIPVRNVAQMVIKHAYHVYSFDAAGLS